jgi:hypothetical protein
VIGIVVDFDDQPVRTGSDRRPCHGRDLVAPARAMARVGQDGQVTELLHHGNGRDVERIARVALERANPALAQHDIHVAAGQDVLGGQQPLFNRGRDAALQENRRARATEFSQQGKVLHVARANLQDMRVLLNQLELADVHHF